MGEQTEPAMNKLRLLILEYYPKLFARRGFAKFNQMLVDIGYRGLGILNWKDTKLSGEIFFTKYLIRTYNPTLIFDIGANQGDYSKNFLASGAEIYCFEPVPNTFERLKNNIGGSANVTLINKGMSDVEGTAIIYDYENSAGSTHASLFKEVFEVYHSETKELEIELITVDHFLEENNIEHISLLKIDTEGNELKVLQGAKKTLENGKVDIIQFEFNEMNVSSGSFFKYFLGALRNYNIYRLLPKGLLPIDYTCPHRYEIFAYQNIIAIRKDIDKE